MIFASEHTPDRPAWTCRRCGEPYPCPEGRRRLAAVHQRGGELGVVAFELLEQAVRDLPDASVTELYDRFVAWSEPARSG